MTVLAFGVGAMLGVWGSIATCVGIACAWAYSAEPIRLKNGVIALLLLWGKPVYALSIAALLLAQIAAMRVLLGDPKGKAPWYNGTGVLFYVSGMMIAAFALRSMGGI